MKTEPIERMSLTETAYKFIFEGILNGRFRAGQSISPDSIAQSLKISKTPIREALVQLEVEGLIFRNGRYYNVIFLDEREVLELYEIRAIMEWNVPLRSASLTGSGSGTSLSSLSFCSVFLSS